MKIKTLQWDDYPSSRTILSADIIPQMLYKIEPSWNDYGNTSCVRAVFMHGYISANAKDQWTDYVGKYDTVELAKAACQTHFKNYIEQNFCEKS